MIVLESNPDKILDYKKRTEEFLKENPDCEGHIRVPNHLHDMFRPYGDWVNDFTENDKEELRVVEDDLTSFDGFYITADHNDHYRIKYFTDYDTEDHLYHYGVCDNASQIIHQIETPENSIVLMTPVFQENEPEWGGWRWHKWGKYIGVQDPQCEYIHDEENVRMVYCYSVVTLKKSNER